MPLSSLPYTAEELELMLENLKRQAALEGLDFSGQSLEGGLIPNTHRALVVGTWAQEEHPDRFEALHSALFESHFARGENLNEMTVLRRAVETAGLDAAEMDEVLESGRYDELLERTSAEARRMSITGVPAFLFDGRFVVMGAQPIPALEGAIERALSDGIPKPITQ